MFTVAQYDDWLFISDRVSLYGSSSTVDKRTPPSGNPGLLATLKSTGASGEPRQLPMGVVRPEGKQYICNVFIRIEEPNFEGMPLFKKSKDQR